MLTFLTFFLGLTVGSKTVEVAIDKPIVAIELRLDDETIAELKAPLWKTEVDFGDDLEPHQLLAIGRNSQGEEVARAKQWINMPRPAAETRLVLERDSEDHPVAARLVWASRHSEAPSSVQIFLDGVEIPSPDLARIELPQLSREELHVLRAEIAFDRDHRSQAVMTFGGTYGSGVQTQLTALPVASHRGTRLPALSELKDIFWKGEQKLLPVAIEREGGDAILVQDPATREVFRASVARTTARRRRVARGNANNPGRELLSLGRKDRITFVWPMVSQAAEGAGIDYSLFAASKPISADDTNFENLLYDHVPEPIPHRIADAVALAGLTAVAGNRARAVVLILSAETPDASFYRAAEVRRFLTQLRVPLFVWSPSKDVSSIERHWGEVTKIAGYTDLEPAVRELRKTLSSQTIVWLDGIHRPQAIRLEGEAAEGLRIAGGGEG